MRPYISLAIATPKTGRHTCSSIVEAISGFLQGTALNFCGYRLPPIRILANQLVVSKNTVAKAYEELAARGLVESRLRYGFVIKEVIPQRRSCQYVAPPAPQFKPSLFHQQNSQPGKINLSQVFIDPELLPSEQLTSCCRSVLTNPGFPTNYHPQGYQPLREAIAKRLLRRGITCKADEIIITTGSQQALDLVCRSLQGKAIATEDPGYAIGKKLFSQLNMKVRGLPINLFERIDFSSWNAILAKEKVDLLYLTPSFQNPTGFSFSSSDLYHLLKLAERHQCAVLEDDWGSDMLSSGDFRPSLRSLGGSNVLYMNSFTKKLLPSLRLGYIVAPKSQIAPLIAAKRVACLGSPTLIEMTLFEFLDRGYYDRFLAKLQVNLDERYQHCVTRLQEKMPEKVRWTTPGGGPLLWIEVPRKVDLAKLKQRIHAEGIVINTCDDAFTGMRHLHGFSVGYAFLNKEQMERALSIAGKIIGEMIDA